MENKEIKQEKCTPKSYKLRPTTQEEINAALSSEPNRTTDQIIYDMAHAYNLAKRGKSLTSHTDDMKQFDDCISHLKGLYCTALEGSDAMQAAMQDRYDQLIQNAQNNIEELSAREKAARETLEKAEKEADAALQRAHDLEDKLVLLTKASKISDARISDLTAQLSSASEKASQYDALLEENKTQADRIRNLEEETRALKKDLVHAKEVAEQQIRIVQLEAEKKISAATATGRPAETAPKDLNLDLDQELPFN